MKSGKMKKISWSSITPLLGVIFVFLLFGVLTGFSNFRLDNLAVIINQAWTFCIMGFGAIFVFGHGGFDFSIGSALGMCATLASLTIIKGLPVSLAVIISIVFGGFSGFLVGCTTELLGLTPFIAGLCWEYIWRGVVQVIVGYDYIYLPPEFCATWTNWYFKIVVLIVLFLVAALLLNRTKVGKYQKAIGGSRVVATFSGVPCRKYVIWSHIIAGLATGIAAIFVAARSAQVYPQTGAGFETKVLISCVLGGMPLGGGNGVKVSSVVIGAITYVALTNGFTLIGLKPTIADGITGVILIIVVTLSYKRERGKEIV